MPEYATGPAHRARSRGAVNEAYAETDALSRPCAPPPKGCGVAVDEFCCFPDGSQKHVACISRTVGHSTPHKPGAGE